MSHRVIIVAAPHSDLMDVAGPYEVFSTAAHVHAYLTQKGGRHTVAPFYSMQLAAISGKVRALPTESGLSVVPHLVLSDLVARRGASIDTLVVVGGAGARRASRDAEAARVIRLAAERSTRVASVCTGAFLLAAAGLLSLRRATTHWSRCEQLQQRFPDVVVERDPIYVRDGKYWTSAGVTAGIDLALAMVEQDLGRELALGVARQLVVFVRRSGGQSQFSAQLAAQTAERSSLRELQSFIVEHPNAELDVPALARRAAMSVRHFSRSFRAETGTSPAAFVERVRVETARRLLETSQDGVEQIAARAGFGTPEALRRAFGRRVGVSPREYRARFGVQSWESRGESP